MKFIFRFRFESEYEDGPVVIVRLFDCKTNTIISMTLTEYLMLKPYYESTMIVQHEDED